MTIRQSILYQRMQPLLLAVVAPVVLILLGWLYMGNIHILLVEELQRSLDYTASQEASIISARIEGRLLALGTLATHPIVRDPDMSMERKLALVKREVEQRGLVRVGIITMDGKGFTSDGYEGYFGERKFFTEGSKGFSHISNALVCIFNNILIVVHSVPVRNMQGEVQWVLFATERATHVWEGLNTRFTYEGAGSAAIIDGNGMLLGADSLKDGNFFKKFAAENDLLTLERFRKQMGTVPVGDGVSAAHAASIASAEATPPVRPEGSATPASKPDTKPDTKPASKWDTGPDARRDMGQGLEYATGLGLEANPPGTGKSIHGTPPMQIYSYEGERVYMRTASVPGSSGWTLLLVVPESAAVERLSPLLNLTVLGLGFVALLLVGCGLYILALRRGYVRQQGFTAAAVHAAGMYQLEVEPDGQIYHCNRVFRQRMSWGEKDALPRLQDLSSEASQNEVVHALKKGELFAQKIIDAEGHDVYVQWHIIPGHHSGKIVLLGTDFSEREHAAEQQRDMASMRDMQNIFDNIPFPMALRNADNSLRLGNRCLLATVGEELLFQEKQRFGGLVGEGESDRLNESFARAVATKASTSMPHTMRQSDGSLRNYENTQMPLLDEDGEVTSVVSISVDVTDALRVQELLAQEVQRLRALLDSSPVGVVILVKGIVRFRNLRARQLVGLDVGNNVWDVPLIEGDARGMFVQLEKKTVVRDVPFRLLDPQKRMRHLLVTGSRTMLEGETGTLLWAVDVTPLKEAEGELILARDTAEAATRAKSDFLATMSHEIRTPMNAVLGFVHLFERGNLNPHQLDYLEKISISASGLLRIINDILDFSKIEAGKLEMEQLPFFLSSCTDATHSIMGFGAREKGLVLTTRVAPDVPAVISGDRQRLNQVLINLLSNAVKFTEKGSVRLEVSVDERFDDGSLSLSFCVSDTGIGMTDEQISRIFQAFAQADSSTSRKFGGTGLGLVISRRLVQLMGGDIEVTSGANGTSFSFAIRVTPGEPEDVPDVGSALSEQGVASMERLRGLRVLVAEDNEINQEIAGTMLSQWGLEVDFAFDGVEAVAMVQQKNYALIFMDMQMPNMDGLQATREIRALGDKNPALRSLPIVAMTANAMLNDRRRCLEVGMNDHLGKPIDPEQMRRQLLHWIR